MKVKDERRQGWWWAHNAVIDTYGPALGAHGVALYAVLCRYANKQGKSWPSIARLAATLAMSKNGVRKAMAKLVTAKLVEINARTAHDGSRDRNLYRLLPAEGGASSAPPSQPDAPGVVHDDGGGGGAQSDPEGLPRREGLHTQGLFPDAEPSGVKVSRGRSEKKETDPRVAPAIAAFDAAHREAYRLPYPVGALPREGMLLRGLAPEYTAALILAAIPKFFADPDPWLGRPGNATIANFVRRLPDYCSERAPRDEEPIPPKPQRFRPEDAMYIPDYEKGA